MSNPVKNTVGKAIALSLLFMSSAAVHANINQPDHNVDISASVITTKACVATIVDLMDIGDIAPIDIHDSNSKPSKYKILDVNFSNCVDHQSLNVSVLGTADEHDASILANTAQATPAKGVGIGFWEEVNEGGVLDLTRKTLIPVNDGVTENTVIGVTHQSVRFEVALVKNNGAAVTGGNISADAQLQINYL